MAVQNNANIGFEKQIWDAACVLWGHIPAAEYRKVIVGLIFLRYISSAFEKRYEQLVEDGDGFEDDKDAYAEDNIFFVPEAARWSKIASAAHKPEIGTVIDDAMRAIEKENTTLKNVLPKNYASPDLDKRVLGEVVDLFTNMDMGDTEESKDIIQENNRVSMNMWAGYPCFIDYLENGFKEFLLDDSGDELTKEYLLPIIVDQLIKTNRASVKVLETTDKWFGVTYPEDKLIVQDSINELIEQGIYPEKLWK